MAKLETASPRIARNLMPSPWREREIKCAQATEKIDIESGAESHIGENVVMCGNPDEE